MKLEFEFAVLKTLELIWKKATKCSVFSNEKASDCLHLESRSSWE